MLRKIVINYDVLGGWGEGGNLDNLMSFGYTTI